MARTPYFDPRREALAVAALRQHLTDIGVGEDPELLMDCIEGETSFNEMVDHLLGKISETTALRNALSDLISELEARERRFAARESKARRWLEEALTLAELPKIERPGATVSLRAGIPKVEVVDEALIPDRYWKFPPRVLDKRLLGDDLKDRRNANADRSRDPLPNIPGATLSNGPPVLSIRVS